MRQMSVYIILAGLLTGCQGTPRYGGGYHTAEGDRKDASETANAVTTAQQYAVDPLKMGQIIDRHLGKPYAGKSQERKGYDCSEFVGEIYEEYASVHLPRTAENLFTAGRKVRNGDLFFGDLVFFDTGGRGVSHVGIYVGFGEFVHSSTSNGVIISSLDDKYYKKRYLGARRVME